MPLTLREALTMAEPLRKARIRAGRQGLDNVVTSVNVMEVPDIQNWVRPGQLLVTTLYPLHDDSDAIEALVPSLAERELAGLAITPSGFLEELPQCMLDAADELGFPLIELPPKVSFIDIIQPLTTRILYLQAEELRQSESILRQFIDLVLGGGSYTDIAQVIAQVVECPVSIIDRFRRVLGSSSIIGQATIQKDFIRHDTSEDSYLNDLYKPDFIERIASSEASHMKILRPGGAIDCIICPVTASSMILGEIILWGPLSHPLPFTHLMAIEHGSTVTALRMMVTRSIDEVEQRFQNEILEALLSDQPHVRERMMYFSHELSNRLSPPYVVIIVKPDLAWDTLLTKTALTEQRNMDSSLHLAGRYIRRLVPDATFWHQGPRLVVFVPVQPTDISKAKTHLTEELCKVCDRIARENSPYTVSIGLGTVMSDLEDFRQAYEQAEQSLELGRVFQGEAVSVVYHYEDLGLFRIVSLADSSARLQAFCRDTIGALIEYDNEKGTDLCHTLRVLLEQHQNLTQTAKLLHVHYNTLRYRIDRIKRILGDVLDDPQQRLAIELALQFYRLADDRID
jgi:purine catabolism regulator